MGASAGRQLRLVVVGRDVVDLARHHLQRVVVRHRDLRERTLEEGADVLTVGAPHARLWSARIRGGRQALAAQDVDPASIAVEGHTGRIPAGRHEAAHPALTRRRHVDHGDVVVVGVGHEQRGAVGRQREGIRGRSWRRVREERHANLLDRALALEIHDPDRVRVRAGDEEPRSVLRQQHGVRVFPHGDVVLELERLGVEGEDLAAAPERDEEDLPVGRHDRRVRLGAEMCVPLDLAPFEIDQRYRRAEDLHRVEPAAIR